MALNPQQFGKVIGVLKTEPHRVSDQGIDIVARQALDDFRRDAKRFSDKLRTKASNAKKDNGAYAVVYSTKKFADWSKYRTGEPREYAIYVHENVHAKHETGQAKYLEQPYREHKEELKDIVRKHAARAGQAGGGVRFGLYQAARKLLAYSQKLVPVETGLLKASGHIERER